MGEQKETLDMAIKALDSWRKYSEKLWQQAYERGKAEALEAQSNTPKRDNSVLERVEDCVSRSEVLKVMCDSCPMYNCITRCQSYRSIEKMPLVTPTISDAENDYDIGYNCGYTDAMSDMADMRGDTE